jgi:hypothetical protein
MTLTGKFSFIFMIFAIDHKVITKQEFNQMLDLRFSQQWL